MRKKIRKTKLWTPAMKINKQMMRMFKDNTKASLRTGVIGMIAASFLTTAAATSTGAATVAAVAMPVMAANDGASAEEGVVDMSERRYDGVGHAEVAAWSDLVSSAVSSALN